MRYSAFLFDLDGTLTDPAAGICRSIRYALEKAGKPVDALESYQCWIGPPLLWSFQTFTGVGPEEARTLVGYYREYFAKQGLFENTVYPGIPELLRDLKERGAKIAVATGKPTVYSEQILEHFHLRPWIDFVSGISLDHEPLDKKETILRALEAIGIQGKAQAVMVGDRNQDAIGARLAGVDFVGVLYGYGDRRELEKEGASILADSVRALHRQLIQ